MEANIPSFINLRSTGTSGHLTRYDDGRFLSVWTDFDRDGGAYVYGKVFNPDGTAAGEHFLIDYVAEASYREITAESLADGRTVVAWVRSDGSGATVVGKVLSKTFAPLTGIITIGSAEVSEEEAPQLVALAGGGFSAFYRGKMPIQGGGNGPVQMVSIVKEQNGIWAFRSTRLDEDGYIPPAQTINFGPEDLFLSVYSY